MSAKQLKVTPSAKAPVFVAVYNQLYDDIVNGVFEVGEQLPSENELAQKYGVSRSTLRQAMLVLQDDGFVRNVQGKGNFLNHNYDKFISGFEKTRNPAVTFGQNCCDEVETNYLYDIPAVIVQEKLNIPASEPVLVINTNYRASGTAIATSFMAIRSTIVAEQQVDLANDEALTLFADEQLYKLAARVQSRVRITTVGEFLESEMSLSQDSLLYFIEEVLYDRNNRELALCKYYLPADRYSLCITKHW